MSAAHAVIAALLGLAVLVELVCCAGILVMRTPLQRLHFIGPASMVCPVLIALAVAVSKNPLSGAGLKALFIAAVLVAFAPVASHATGRAALARRGPDHP
ncbi:MAG: multicomponent Na+:H+ antiporter subunit [Candidatus Eremiobacteraeota bacterium]|nr:multicomponent Na+:H+ antiporter subunit [Candidatus Eremiobacteraeota bacterium]